MYADIVRETERNRANILEFIKKMVSFETPDPPAHNTKEIQTWMEGELKGMGMKTHTYDLYPDEPVLVGLLEGSDPE